MQMFILLSGIKAEKEKVRDKLMHLLLVSWRNMAEC